MRLLWQIILFAAALSLDSFAAGLAYGAGGIKIPFFSRLLLVGASGATLALSMSLGGMLAGLLPEKLTALLSGALLLILAAVLFRQAQRGDDQPNRRAEQEITGQMLVCWQIPLMGLIIQVLRDPSKLDADFDRRLSNSEALMLGLALSLDSFGAGFAVAMSGFSISLTVFLSICFHFALLSLALALGDVAAKHSKKTRRSKQRYIAYIPAAVIAILGLTRLLGGIL